MIDRDELFKEVVEALREALPHLRDHLAALRICRAPESDEVSKAVSRADATLAKVDANSDEEG